MRAIWKGAVSFGLVNVPVKLYAATESHDVSFRQVHAKDGGRIKYQRICSVDGEEVAYADIAKGYETEDGEMVILEDEDLASLPSASSREIAVEKFVPSDQIDPMLFEKSYYLEPEKTGAKPYALLRQALQDADRMAVVTVAIRNRTSIAVLRVRDDVIVLQTMMWPDEVRVPDFSIDSGEVKDSEVKMARMLVETLAGDFDADEFTDDYADAVEAVVKAKIEGGEVQRTETSTKSSGEVVDLLAALQRSVQAAKKSRGEAVDADEDEADDESSSDDGAGREEVARRGGGRRRRRHRVRVRRGIGGAREEDDAQGTGEEGRHRREEGPGGEEGRHEDRREEEQLRRQEGPREADGEEGQLGHRRDPSLGGAAPDAARPTRPRGTRTAPVTEAGTRTVPSPCDGVAPAGRPGDARGPTPPDSTGLGPHPRARRRPRTHAPGIHRPQSAPQGPATPADPRLRISPASVRTPGPGDAPPRVAPHRAGARRTPQTSAGDVAAAPRRAAAESGNRRSASEKARSVSRGATTFASSSTRAGRRSTVIGRSSSARTTVSAACSGDCAGTRR